MEKTLKSQVIYLQVNGIDIEVELDISKAQQLIPFRVSASTPPPNRFQVTNLRSDVKIEA